MHKKRQSSQQCHLALLGHTSIKAAHKMLVKLTPGCKFTKLLRSILCFLKYYPSCLNDTRHHKLLLVLRNLKILGPKVTKNLRICLKRFCESRPSMKHCSRFKKQSPTEYQNKRMRKNSYLIYFGPDERLRSVLGFQSSTAGSIMQRRLPVLPPGFDLNQH
jgi:hypothetical protein